MMKGKEKIYWSTPHHPLGALGRGARVHGSKEDAEVFAKAMSAVLNHQWVVQQTEKEGRRMEWQSN